MKTRKDYDKEDFGGTADERQVAWGEGNRKTHFPQRPPPHPLRKAAIIAGVGLTALLTTCIVRAEPDFNKLPTVYKIHRDAVAITPEGEEAGRYTMGYSTLFKLNKQYYVTANHVGEADLPAPKDEANTVREEWYVNDKDDNPLTIVARSEEHDVMILTSKQPLGGSPVTICKKKPRIGEMSYLYGYNRGQLSLSEGRVGNLELRLLGDKKHKDYISDADALPGSSGSPTLLYRNRGFCTYGVLLGNVDRGYFSISRDIDYAITLYKNLVLNKEGLSLTIKW